MEFQELYTSRLQQREGKQLYFVQIAVKIGGRISTLNLVLVAFDFKRFVRVIMLALHAAPAIASQ